MVAADSGPLLSICIPTYNRAAFLKVMLQALLPQVREFADEVEVWVLDNASTDDTSLVLQSAAELGPLRVKKQCKTIGPTRNIVDGPANLARGQYVWVLGDHNLLRPGAIRRLLNELRQSPEYEIFYINYRVAVFPEQWPATATDGYDGVFTYLGNPEVSAGAIREWCLLMRPYSALCTQNYVHVIRTSVWRDFWKERPIGADYSDALTTYPHTTMIVNTLFRVPAFVVADPLLTIFNGAQSWSNPVTQAKVYFVGLPAFLDQLRRLGIRPSEFEEIMVDFYRPEATRIAVRVLQHLGLLAGLRLLLRGALTRSFCVRPLLLAIPDGVFPGLTKVYRTVDGAIRNYRASYLYNCKPMRWLRERRNVSSS
ncbi:MAG: Abequosyltransferase RfbV [Planctomycetota bacterium]|jgi:glycosyltransferase involved in cell wall biosynthesis